MEKKISDKKSKFEEMKERADKLQALYDCYEQEKTEEEKKREEEEKKQDSKEPKGPQVLFKMLHEFAQDFADTYNNLDLKT